MRAFETESTRRLASLTRSGQLETCRRGRASQATYLERSNALLDAVVIDAKHDEVVPADLLNVILVRHCQRTSGQHTLVDRSRRISRVICAYGDCGPDILQ